MSHGRRPERATSRLTMEEAGLAHHTPCGHQAEKAGLMALSSRGGNWGAGLMYGQWLYITAITRPGPRTALFCMWPLLTWYGGHCVKLRFCVWLWRGGMDGGEAALQVSL